MLSAHPDLQAALEQALAGCSVVFDMLELEIRKLAESIQSGSSHLDKIANISCEGMVQLVWTEKRGLQPSLNLLLK